KNLKAAWQAAIIEDCELVRFDKRIEEMAVSERTRVERDSMGTMDVPIDAYYGASTQRAVLNFPHSDLRFSRTFIRALALIKYCAAEVNQELGDVQPNVAEAIKKAAMEVADGKFDNQFV